MSLSIKVTKYHVKYTHKVIVKIRVINLESKRVHDSNTKKSIIALERCMYTHFLFSRSSGWKQWKGKMRSGGDWLWLYDHMDKIG